MLKKIYKISFKFAAIILTVVLNVGILNIPVTNAYFNDTESSDGNVFITGLLDFILTNNNLIKLIGPEALGEISHASVAMPENGSLPMQYVLNTLIATTTSNSDFCDGLVVEAKKNGLTEYLGSLSGLGGATTTDFGTWEFRFDLPPNVSVPHGAQCNASALFSAWRQDIINPADSGWHDEEILNISLIARMVVLNEIYARPAAGDREFIELYNNGNTSVDVSGWKISEISGTTEKFYTISTAAISNKANPVGGSTIIPAYGFITLNLSDGTALNNTGDTVKLYDGDSVLLDSHIYPSIATGKSVVRFPDGIGFWVDPDPTPGAANIVSIEDLRMAGFDDLMIAEVLELALIKNASVLESQNIETGDGGINEVATTTPEILATSTVETEILEESAEAVETTIEPTTPEEIEQPELLSFEEEEIIEAEDVSTTPEIITNEPAAIPPEPELITSETSEAEPAVEPEPVIVPEAVIIEPEPATSNE